MNDTPTPRTDLEAKLRIELPNDTKNTSDKAVDLPRLVLRFEVLNRTGEHDWEEASGPYATYEEAEKARLNWFRKDDIPSMRVVEFYPPNAKHTHPPTQDHE